MEEQSPSAIRQLVVELINERYEGVTFSDEILDSIEDKVAPAIRTQTEATVVDFVSNFFSSKKVSRKPRKPKAKKIEETPATEPTEAPKETADEPATQATAPKEAVAETPTAEAPENTLAL